MLIENGGGVEIDRDRITVLSRGVNGIDSRCVSVDIISSKRIERRALSEMVPYIISG
jgi:hypothetical protein